MGRIRVAWELKGVAISVNSLEDLSQVMLVMMLARWRPNALSEVEMLRTWRWSEHADGNVVKDKGWSLENLVKETSGVEGR
eukprot:scaffold40854_cov183-Skeletonema_dohrnii-CCMP3373.AAC.1